METTAGKVQRSAPHTGHNRQPWKSPWVQHEAASPAGAPPTLGLAKGALRAGCSLFKSTQSANKQFVEEP